MIRSENVVLNYVCTKCDYANLEGTRRCIRCGTRLYLTCRECASRNPRSASSCAKCGHRLRRGLLRRWQSKLLPRHGKIRPVEVLLVLVMLAIIYWYIQWIGARSIPTPSGQGLPE
jgi:ribosomal protein L40E